MICKDFKYPVLLEHFEKISSIPRMSHHEGKIAAYLMEFAKERGLEAYTDEANNVLVNVPATKGYEGRDAVLLQGHTDMVCEKNLGCEHDFLTQGLDLYVENGFLRARGTTLGADDGFAVALMMALIDGEIEPHPTCQCLFTASEEVGLDGAKAFDYSRIFARKMINMDGAEEKYLIVGCAGGIRSDIFFEGKYEEKLCKNVLRITIGGLMGGHSGENINCGRKNANILAGELLNRLRKVGDFSLISFDGGSKDNAIPREAVLVIGCESDSSFKKEISSFEGEVKKSLVKEDSGFFINTENIESGAKRVFTKEFTDRIIDFEASIENGVLSMSNKIEGLVEFSRNLGIVVTKKEGIGFYYSTRSAIEEQIDLSASTIDKAATKYGGSTYHHSRYPGWNYTGKSVLADMYIDAAKSLFGMDVVKTVLHAGLECGIVKQAIPDMEIISCGPNANDIHSPAEALDLASYERFFATVKKVVQSI